VKGDTPKKRLRRRKRVNIGLMRVVTWNINGGYGLVSTNPRKYTKTENLSFFLEHLNKLNADILCLQEVHTNPNRSPTKLIAETLGYSYTFETAASSSHIDPDYQLANAVLSKQPFKTTKAVRLPRPQFLSGLPLLPNGQRAEIHDKVLQVVEFETFTLANTHTLPLHVLNASYDSEDGKRFAKEIEEVFLEHLKTPLVFCGDFNHKNIALLYPKLFSELELTDALPDEPSVPNPDVRIDYMLVSRNCFQVKSTTICQVLADHFPCLLELSVI
jgi:endonuclease/exonuclease/phosphatase family metal-dependent hydrolase